MKNIILFGLKNSGKTTFGKIISKKKLKADFIDTDLLIENLFLKKTSKSFSHKKIYKLYGDLFFRELEKQAILSLKNIKNAVISLGGGSLLNKEVLKFVKNIGTLIYLKISFKTFVKNTFLKNPPVYLFEDKNPQNLLKKIYRERTKIFNSISAKVIKVDKLSKEEIIEEIINGI